MEDRALLAAFLVNTTLDTVDASPGDGVAADVGGNTSLRAAIMEANALSGADAITLPAGTYQLTLTGAGEDAGASGDLDVLSDLTIAGAGASETIVDAAGLDRVLDVKGESGQPNVTFGLSGVTITGGRLAAVAADGGGIRSDLSNITVADAIIRDNRTADGGDFPGAGGGIYVTRSNLMVQSSTITGNLTGNGTIFGGFGGGIGSNVANVTIENSTVSSNRTGDGRSSHLAGYGAGVHFENGHPATVSLTIDHSTIADNITGTTTTGRGGGILTRGGTDLYLRNSQILRNTGYDGGGIALDNGVAQLISNSTIAGNVSHGFEGGGGIHIEVGRIVKMEGTTISGNTALAADTRVGGGGGIMSQGRIDEIINSTISGNSTSGTGGGIANQNQIGLILNSTIADNSAMSGGGIHTLRSFNGTEHIGRMDNTVVADNTAADNKPRDLEFTEAGLLKSAQHNLVEDPAGHSLVHGTNGHIIGVDPLLGALQDNSGPTLTHALLDSSPAIDAAYTSNAPATDQRGAPRPQGSAADIGAYEFGVTDIGEPMLTISIDAASISEDAGSATVIVRRNTDTSSSLAVSLANSDTTEATVPDSVTIPAGEASASFVVNAVNDFEVDGTQSVTITASAIGHADGRGLFDVTDDDTAGVVITPTSGLITSESGGTASYTAVLTSKPVADVIFRMVTSHSSEGTAAPSSLTFTPLNWNVEQTVTVTGVDDSVVDGDRYYEVHNGRTVSDDANYSGISPRDVVVLNRDNDVAGFTVTESDGSTSVSETGTTDTFTVVLDAQPLTDVVLTVASGDTGEASVDKATLTFTPANWNTAQTVTVTGVDDLVDDGDQTTAVTIGVDAAGSDDAFDLLASQTVSVTTADNDAAGFTVTESGGNTVVSESGSTDTFDVVLDSEPLTNVVLTISSGDTGEASVDKATLTFTPANWNTAQTVTVTGVDDLVDDGDQTTAVTIGVDAAGSDDAFDLLASQTVSVTTADDDAADVLEVLIDIKPGSASNPINPRSGGNTKVAILSTDTFDAVNNLDIESLTFGRTGEETSLARKEDAAPDVMARDVNGDGILDVVAMFVTREAGFQAGDVEGVLRGETLSGRAIEGSDTVRIVGSRQTRHAEGEPREQVHTMDEVWHNWAMPMDTNDDGTVSALDALIIVNSLNRGLGGALPQLPDDAEIDFPFLDNNNDGQLSPLDALRVINRLNRRVSTGEGEAAVSSDPWADQVDAVHGVGDAALASLATIEELKRLRRG